MLPAEEVQKGGLALGPGCRALLDWRHLAQHTVQMGCMTAKPGSCSGNTEADDSFKR